MAKGHGNGAKARKPKEFKIDDARKLFVMRHFVLTIEKKLFEMLASDDEKSTKFMSAKDIIRDTLEKLDAANQPQPHRLRDCYDDYELCGDGICRVWCSQ